MLWFLHVRPASQCTITVVALCENKLATHGIHFADCSFRHAWSRAIQWLVWPFICSVTTEQGLMKDPQILTPLSRSKTNCGVTQLSYAVNVHFVSELCRSRRCLLTFYLMLRLIYFRLSVFWKSSRISSGLRRDVPQRCEHVEQRNVSYSCFIINFLLFKAQDTRFWM
jgi:hypothetical protein